ncbi:CENP-B protein, partial [Morchella conica CCBAS932]
QLQYTTDKYKIIPKNTYNMDETGFILGMGDEVKRICRNIRKDSVYKEFKNRESCSVVECISTDGFTVTPLVIFKGSNHIAAWFKDAKLESYWYGHSPKGYNNSVLCLEYLQNIFEPETSNRSNGEWRLLIFDGFESHLQLEIIEFCLDNKIIPLCLPSHTSHVLQPLDVGVFSPLKKYYRQEISKLRSPITKNNFPNLLALARQKAFSVSNIQSGFRASGIYPYNPTVVLNTL